MSTEELDAIALGAEQRHRFQALPDEPAWLSDGVREWNAPPGDALHRCRFEKAGFRAYALTARDNSWSLVLSRVDPGKDEPRGLGHGQCTPTRCRVRRSRRVCPVPFARHLFGPQPAGSREGPRGSAWYIGCRLGSSSRLPRHSGNARAPGKHGRRGHIRRRASQADRRRVRVRRPPA
jgi:hypothetical protein